MDQNEKVKKERLFNATIKEITNYGLMTIEFDEKVNWKTTPVLNSSNIDIYLNITNEDFLYKMEEEKLSKDPIPVNETINHKLSFSWNVTNFVNRTLEI